MMVMRKRRLMQVYENNLANLKEGRDDPADHPNKIGRVVVQKNAWVECVIKTVDDISTGIILGHRERQCSTDTKRAKE
jgi:hypothetical protein